MLVLWESEPKGVKELGEELGLDSGTLSPLLKRLEAMGLVERRRFREDERRVAVHVTPDGRSLSSRAGEIPRHLADAAGLSANDLEQLRTTLERLTEALRRAH